MSDIDSERTPEFTCWANAVMPHWERTFACSNSVELATVLDSMEEPVRHLILMGSCLAEVCNGGFIAWFDSTYADFAPETVTAFRIAGANEIADLVARAILALGAPYPRDLMARNAIMMNEGSSVGESVEDMSNDFYELMEASPPNRQTLDDIMDQYALDHLFHARSE